MNVIIFGLVITIFLIVFTLYQNKQRLTLKLVEEVSRKLASKLINHTSEVLYLRDLERLDLVILELRNIDASLKAISEKLK